MERTRDARETFLRLVNTFVTGVCEKRLVHELRLGNTDSGLIIGPRCPSESSVGETSIPSKLT
jgi:hypothetical protein